MIKVFHKDHINVLCMTLFWLDDYNPNTSSKGNKKRAWAGSRMYILYDIQEQQVYFEDTLLFTAGPGKGNSKKDHTEI